MSYILDALRRADAERERGRVPGLHSQVAPRAAAMAPPARTRKRRSRTAALPWALGGGAVLVVALAGWWMRGSEAPPAPATAGASGPVADARPDVAPPPVPVPATAPVAAAQAPTEPVLPILAPAPPPAPPAAAPARAATATAAPAPADTDATLPRLADLTPEARAQIPPVQVSGSTYSDNAALRMLIVNGKVVQEGQDIAPGFKLESIGPRTAVLNHQGRRFRVGH